MLQRLRKIVTPPSVEQRTALLAGKHITYTLKRSGKRRSIGLNIDDRGLIVKCSTAGIGEMAAKRVAGQGALGGGKAGWLADLSTGCEPLAEW